MHGGPVQQFQRTVKVFHQRGTTFNPVAIIAIQNTIDLAHLGAVDVPAYDPLVTTPLGFVGNSDFKISHVIECALYLLLEVSRQ